MYYPEDIVEEVKNANDIVDVISSYIKLTKKGGNYFGLCPFHSEKTPSFSVSPQKQIYYCFGCHSGGNVISFVMQYENYTFEEALKMLAERAGMKLPEIKADAHAQEDRDIKTRLLEIHKIAANYYYRELTGEHGEAGLSYFKKRGLTEETIRHFGLGYTGKGSDRLYRMLKSLGYSDELLKQSGLVTIEEKGAHDKFWNRVMFPLMDINNKVIGFGGRVLGDGLPKYMNSPETRIFEKNRFLFGLNYARKTRRDYFFLCEGNMDVIAMHQAGYTNAVASLGTSLTANQPSLIKRYVSKVILTYDSDDAGIAAAERAIPMLNDAGIAVKILDLSPYKDPDEFLNHLGNEEFDKRIENAQNSFLWSIGILRKKYDIQDPQQKTEFEHSAAQRLSTFTESLERDNYIRAVSNQFMIPYNELRNLVNRIGSSGSREKDYEAIRRENRKIRRLDDGLTGTQNYVLSEAAANESYCRQIFKYLEPADFAGELYQELADKLRNGINSATILNGYLNDSEKMNQVAGILNGKTTDEDSKAALAAAIQRIKQAALEQKSNEAPDFQSLQNIMKEQAVWKNRKITLV